MKTGRRKWYTRWIAVCVAIVLGVGMYTGMPIHAATSADMTISQNGIDFIKEREGFSAKCYYDGAQSSIGYGTKCGTKAHASGLHSITRADAETAMRNEIVSSYIPNVRRQTSGIEMNQNQFDALVSFTYNTGGGTSMIKNSPLVKYLRGEMSQAAAASAFESYVVTNSATGKVDSALKNRRRLEAKLFFSGVNPNPPTVSNISIDKALYAVGENVVFHVSSDKATGYLIGIYRNGERVDTTESFSESIYNYTPTTTGDYSAYVTSYNSSGYVDSALVYFSVYDSKPIASFLKTDKSNYSVGETIKFTIESDNAVNYAIGIYKDNERIDSIASDTNEVSYTITKAGNYSAYVTSSNAFGYLDSNRNDCHFNVYDSKPEISILKTNKSKYLVGETVKFVIESDNAVNYAIGIYRDNERIDSIASDINEVSYTITKAGNYSAYVTSSNAFGYLDSNRNDCHFCVYSSEQEMTHNGDLNSDNTLTAADAALLQRYLLGEDTLTQNQWQAADLNADGAVNGFDLALLRQKLA